jgi:hypothetical protein
MSSRPLPLLAGTLLAGSLLAATPLAASLLTGTQPAAAATGAAPAATAPRVVPAVAGQPSIAPWPIGAGSSYRPPASGPRVGSGLPLGGLRCRPRIAQFPLHLEIFADRRAVVIPAGIGVARPWLGRGGSVVPRGCTYPAWTETPAGIVEVARGVRLHLSDLFRIWGQVLGSHRIASFRSRSPVRAYVGGRLVSGPAAAIPLAARAEIVLELGGYVAPHASFLFVGVVP